LYKKNLIPNDSQHTINEDDTIVGFSVIIALIGVPFIADETKPTYCWDRAPKLQQRPRHCIVMPSNVEADSCAFDKNQCHNFIFSIWKSSTWREKAVMPVL